MLQINNGRMLVAIISFLFLLTIPFKADSGPFDWFKSKLGGVTSTKLSDTEIGSGLKEALKVGIENTVKLLGQTDGYQGNEAVKIFLPTSMKKIEPALRGMGLGPKIDEFVLSMNRAAEKATPLASDIFATAISDMSIDDVKVIFKGGDTAATEYFKDKTYTKLFESFQPSVQKAMDSYAVTKQYQEIMDRALALPFVGKFAAGLDIKQYVTSQGLEGLFTVLGQQEAKIRNDPAARVTGLLEKVFAN